MGKKRKSIIQDGLDVESFLRCFEDKINDVRATTAGAEHPDYSPFHGKPLTKFSAITVDYVRKLIRAAPQGMWIGSSFYLARQGFLGRTRTFHNDTLQQIFMRGLLSSIVSYGRNHAHTQEILAGCIHSTQLPTDIWPSLPLEAARARRERTVTGTSTGESTSTRTPVGLSTIAFHGDGSPEGDVRCAARCRSGYGHVTRYVGFECRIRLR